MALTKDIQKSIDKFTRNVSGTKPVAMHFNTGAEYIFSLSDVVLSVRIEDCAIAGKSIKFNATTKQGDTIGDKYYKLNRRQHITFADQIEAMVKAYE